VYYGIKRRYYGRRAALYARTQRGAHARSQCFAALPKRLIIARTRWHQPIMFKALASSRRAWRLASAQPSRTHHHRHARTAKK